MTVSDMIHRADEAMYRVKCGGKGDFLLAEKDASRDVKSQWVTG
jgi:hypothetical protein